MQQEGGRHNKSLVHALISSQLLCLEVVSSVGMLGFALMPVHTWSRSRYCFILFLTLLLIFEQVGSRV